MKNAFHAGHCVLILITGFAIVGCGGHASSTPPVAGSNAPPASAPPSSPPNSIIIPDIQKSSGWQNCTACTGNAHAIYSMTQGITSPSLSGSSARFALQNGTRPFGAALWFKFLTTDDHSTNFVLDLYFFMENPSAPQALEFAVVHSAGGHRYNLATQCDMVNQRAWLVWSPSNHWVSTGVPCVQPPPGTWSHLVWEFETDAAGHSIFKAVSLNGNRSEVNMTEPTTRDSGNGVDVSFQADANRTASPYAVWLDKISLARW